MVFLSDDAAAVSQPPAQPPAAAQSPATPATPAVAQPLAPAVLLAPAEAQAEALPLAVSHSGRQARQFRWRDWAITAGILALAAILRFWHLGRPGTLVFDETYYVKDALTLWRLGFEARWPNDIDAAFAAGDVYSYLPEAAFVVHPPVGKWLIGLGLAIGGAENAWAWRLASAIAGVLTVWLVIRVARLLFGSRLLGWIAGFLMAIDGLAIVHSRTAMLDQFLMLFVLAAFLALLLDRRQFRRRLSGTLAPPVDNPAPSVEEPAPSVEEPAPSIEQPVPSVEEPHRGVSKPRVSLPQQPSSCADAALAAGDAGSQSSHFRWWRLLAGVLLGLACGVKWSAAYFVAGFGLLTVWWDFTAYRSLARSSGLPFRQVAWPWVRQALTAFLSIVPVAALTYVASWFSWFRTPGAWGRDWADQFPDAGITWLPPLLRSWVNYHRQVWTFHTGLSDPHPYQSAAWTWLLQIRPTAYFWANADEVAAYPGCADFTDCAMAVNSVGNPILWWLATLAIFVTIWWGIAYRDWRALAALSGIAFGWLPWLLYPERTTFAFYSIAFLPWLIFTLCYAFALLLRIPPTPDLALSATSSTPRHRFPSGPTPRWATWLVGGLLLVIAVISIAFYPIWTAMPIERSYWQWLMWLPSWI